MWTEDQDGFIHLLVSVLPPYLVHLSLSGWMSERVHGRNKILPSMSLLAWEGDEHVSGNPRRVHLLSSSFLFCCHSNGVESVVIVRKS